MPCSRRNASHAISSGEAVLGGGTEAEAGGEGAAYLWDRCCVEVGGSTVVAVAGGEEADDGDESGVSVECDKAAAVPWLDAESTVVPAAGIRASTSTMDAMLDVLLHTQLGPAEPPEALERGEV